MPDRDYILRMAYESNSLRDPVLRSAIPPFSRSRFDFSCDFAVPGFQNEFGLTSLAGERSAGDWTLFVGDGAGAYRRPPGGYDGAAMPRIRP